MRETETALTRGALRASLLTIALIAALAGGPALAGGGWVPDKGDGYVQLGFSRKTADTSWDVNGNAFANTGSFENHDFRYTYLSGEIGLGNRVAFQFLLTHLDGFEGPDGDLERNTGPSDAWFGAKVRLADGKLPQALRVEMRTPYFYDIDGPYERDLYDDTGIFLGHSPEWRGVLKHDYALTYLISGNHQQGGRGWWSAEGGYRHREGAPSAEIPLNADAGWNVGWLNSYIKAAFVGVFAIGNDTPRRPDDRFGARPDFNFNNASMARLGVSWLVPFGELGNYTVEIGFNKWVWGESARRYDEPFASLARSF